jgi:hypothetical protein
MKKIVTKKDLEKKRKKQQTILGVTLALIMVLSAFGAVVGSFSNAQDNELNYNGLKFISYNGYWTTTIGELDFYFRFNPKQTENVSSFFENKTIPLATDYLDKPLYLKSDNQAATSEIYQNTQYFIERIQAACLDNLTCSQDLPIKNCTDNFILIESSEIPSFQIDNKCVFIKGNSEEILMMTDEFLFKTLGIKN